MYLASALKRFTLIKQSLPPHFFSTSNMASNAVALQILFLQSDVDDSHLLGHMICYSLLKTNNLKTIEIFSLHLG